MCAWPARPFFVVTTITPAIARAPYIEVAEPSFRIWKLSISSEFKPAIAEEIRVLASPEESWSADTSTTSSMMTPSTTHRGFDDPKIEVAPRTRILGAVPKVPDTFWTLTPAARPSKERLTSAIPSIFAFDASIFVAAPENNLLSCWVIPVTTTSFRVWLSLESTTLIPAFGLKVCVTIPM